MPFEAGQIQVSGLEGTSASAYPVTLYICECPTNLKKAISIRINHFADFGVGVVCCPGACEPPFLGLCRAREADLGCDNQSPSWDSFVHIEKILGGVFAHYAFLNCMRCSK
tara:strand:- start:171 stop:503 length:333 start_codon:yes stop_codon:yes gene_type:complete